MCVNVCVYVYLSYIYTYLQYTYIVVNTERQANLHLNPVTRARIRHVDRISHVCVRVCVCVYVCMCVCSCVCVCVCV